MNRLTAEQARCLMTDNIDREIGDILQRFYVAIEHAAKKNKSTLVIGVHITEGVAKWIRAELERDGYVVTVKGPMQYGDTHTFYVRWGSSFKLFD